MTQLSIGLVRHKSGNDAVLYTELHLVLGGS